MTILVVGAGGAGGYFAARWAEAGLDVAVLARGATLDAIRASGMHLRTPTGDVRVPLRAVEHAREAGDLDLVVFATKTWQLPDAIAQVASAVTNRTMVLGLQNGVDSVAVLTEQLPQAIVLGGTCRIMSKIEAPGVIRHMGIEPTITIGEPGGGASERTAQLAARLSVGPANAPYVRADASDDVQVAIWRKFLFFAPVSSVGSVTRAPVSLFRSLAQSRALLESAMQEVYAVARAHHVALRQESVAQTLAFVDGLPDGATSSTQRDVIAGRASELEALSGAVVRLGKSGGVPTPVFNVLYGALVPLEAKARGNATWTD